MNPRLSGVILLVGVALICLNHFFLDWQTITSQKIEKHFDALISNQKNDLAVWESFEVGDSEFQKEKFCDGKLTGWSDNKPWVDIQSIDSIKVLALDNGIYLVQKAEDSNGCDVYSLYTIQRKYDITNKFLRSRMNVGLPKNLAKVSERKGQYNYRNLFYYDISNASSRSMDAIGGLMIILVLLWVFWYGLAKNFYLTLLVILTTRIVSLYYGACTLLFRYPIFDSLFYTSSTWNPSLGDLLLNSLLIFLVTLAWSRKFRKKGYTMGRYQLYVFFGTGLGMAIMIYSTTWSILDNSQISLDVGKSIDFNGMRVVAFLTVLLMVGSFFLVTFRSVGILNATHKKNRYFIFLVCIIAIAFLVDVIAGAIGVLYFLIISSSSRLKWANKLKEFRYQNLQFVLLIGLNVAFVLAKTVYEFHEKAELDAKRKFANYLLIKRDVLGEYYLNQQIKEINQLDFEGLERNQIGEQIKNRFINPYLDKYRIAIVDPEKDSSHYQHIIDRLTEEALSDYENIYFLDEETSFHYYCYVGTFLVHLDLKKRVPSSVYPALLTDNRYFTPSDNFDYAVFKDGQILFQRSKFGQGEWPTTSDLQDPDLYLEGIEKNNRHYYGVETVDGRIILIISKKYQQRTQLTNFSFFFLIILFFVGSIVLLSSIRIGRVKLNFTSKIQLYLGLAFIIPLFSAGFALLNSLNTSYKEEINRNYLKRSLYLAELLSNDLTNSVQDITSSRLVAIRDIIQADISLYDSAGMLISTSQREIFDLGLQGNLINPIVYSELISKENQSMITNESIGGLDYKVSYTILNDDLDRVQGFIATPFFDSKNHLNRQQLEVFGSLVIIFGFIFILAILFGNLILNNLMQPLRLVAEKISKVNLQEENKPILFESSDEIGSLVKDYNTMLIKLEESKKALARSQKETAWKEIAKQVAHEIKNPLTPMQLKIQQLLRKQEHGSKDYETLQALFTQVDNLSQIAGSFSAFAEMPAPDNQDFDLSQVIHQVVSLYGVGDVAIETLIEEGIIIHADKDIFQRILNNIVLNAIQSVEGRLVEIHIQLRKKSGKCELSIRDNGKGVPAELRDKIFLNYFSTKSKGSGIGLALAKKGIENAGGNIWFDSEEGVGTTFFISMPLAVS